MNSACHLIMGNGCTINYASRSELPKQFINQLITICNYSAGLSSDSSMTVLLDVQNDLRAYCLVHPEYIFVSRLFAISFNEDYTKSIFLINADLFGFPQKLINITLSMIATINYVMLVASRDYSPVHCTLLKIAGKGALVCASGGVGKSTCATRIPEPHRALADDCALLMRSNNGFIAQAMPTWSTITDCTQKPDNIQFDCSASVKLSGIFFLEQSSKDAVKSLNTYTARGYLNSSFNDQMRWFLTHFTDNVARELRMKMFSLAEGVITELPAYQLCASLDGKFWDVMHEVL